ncbi:family 78 glycoside hydrolase catalytic domain [Chryseolinea sp. T2]|uniref:family 78 glycoside hydrolase catalytic domain n=1 Tax=Chryseolinea sp. T2 TaxID=3129255 RepID=UPI0030782A52
MKKNTFSMLLGTVLLYTSAIAGIVPVHLSCEYSSNPLGIDVAVPRLGWQAQSEERQQLQTAYEIIVSQSEEDAKSGKGTVWSSGKVKTSASVQIVYSGPALKSFTRYYWAVRIFDKNDVASEFSETAWFETAMLNQNEWKGKWIGDGSKQFTRDEEFYNDDRMPLFRKAFSLNKRIEAARLYISGVGYEETFVNGKRVSDHMLDPGWTTYKKEVLYVVHDVTSLVKQGSNVVAVRLGNGWWNALPLRLFGRFNLRDVQQTGRPCLKADLRIRYTDGTEAIIATDESWMTAPGPIVKNNVYLGECYDARLAVSGWNRNASGKGWTTTRLCDGPSGEMHAQMQPPIRVTTVVKPEKITMIQPGVFIVDMGQNFAGVARIRVKGKSGTLVKLRYGEALHPDGSLNYLTTVVGHIKEMWKLSGGPGAPPTAWQQDEYTLSGHGVETWNPSFTFHGFRFIEITGWPGTPTLKDIEGLRMNSDLERVGEFACSNPMFNKLHQAIRWTFLSNVFSVQSDCPGREKMGYGADMVVTANAFLYNYDMTTFYRKAVRDFANEQQPDGGITEIAPYTGIHDRGVGGESGPLGWQLGFIYLQKQLYDFYGDRSIIEANYPGISKQMEFLTSHTVEGLYHWDIGDHETLDPKAEAFSACAFYYHHALLAAEFAGILDKADDSVKYAKLAHDIRERIITKYHVPGTGRFDNATQSAQVFALWYGLTPEKEKTIDVLKQEFERHNWHVASGIFGVKMMFDVLRELDKNDWAYAVANHRDYPSWGYMLENGATTLWESYQYPDNAGSQNHPMFGSIDEWFYRSILGINAAAPGFRKIVIKPQPVADLQWAQGSYRSVYGPIATEWKKDNGKFEMKVTIPVNTEAEVWVPSNGGLRESNGVPIGESHKQGTYEVVRLGSGSYSLESTYQ